ncbi:MAG: 2,3-bisphosphoglycerate-independent phosphoglycerate mutase [archaeon]
MVQKGAFKVKKRVVLVVADGWGIAPAGPGNYIDMARTPNFDGFLKKYPHCINLASGTAVGLPPGSQGNSEVGHLHMGAGRIVWQMYQLINNAIDDKGFFKNKALVSAIDHAKKNNSKLHIMGMCSDEGVHSHVNHLFALLMMAKEHGLTEVYVHFFADGRDVPEKSAKKYVKMVEDEIRRIGVGRIASIVGRYYSMDRDTNWDRTRKAYDMLTKAEGFRAKSAQDAVEMAYERGDKTDYYIQPTVIVDDSDEAIATVDDGDSVIFFNFRIDRTRQLTKAFVFDEFDYFKRDVRPNVLFTTMSKYDKNIECLVAYTEETVENNLGKMLSGCGLLQLRMAETEKYAHVTYYFNSMVEKPNAGEERLMIPSSKVSSYDQKPQMSAYEIADEAARQISKKKYDFVLVNFANCDLVGHSAVKEAIIRCVEVVDECCAKIASAGLNNDYVVIITADHGSAEDKLYPDGVLKPAHSSNPVPFILVSTDENLMKVTLLDGGQKDVAPTILDIMGMKKPKEMTGKSLIIGKQNTI